MGPLIPYWPFHFSSYHNNEMNWQWTKNNWRLLNWNPVSRNWMRLANRADFLRAFFKFFESGEQIIHFDRIISERAARFNWPTGATILNDRFALLRPEIFTTDTRYLHSLKVCNKLPTSRSFIVFCVDLCVQQI